MKQSMLMLVILLADSLHAQQRQERYIQVKSKSPYVTASPTNAPQTATGQLPPSQRSSIASNCQLDQTELSPYQITVREFKNLRDILLKNDPNSKPYVDEQVFQNIQATYEQFSLEATTCAQNNRDPEYREWHQLAYDLKIHIEAIKQSNTITEEQITILFDTLKAMSPLTDINEIIKGYEALKVPFVAVQIALNHRINKEDDPEKFQQFEQLLKKLSAAVKFLDTCLQTPEEKTILKSYGSQVLQTEASKQHHLPNFASIGSAGAPLNFRQLACSMRTKLICSFMGSVVVLAGVVTLITLAPWK